ncbi:GntR family transcriptional regulator [Paenibacillus kribbensis]|uniref:GntR family transcriptional regulator n=1 Tax=Paenibacillus kribbensis TaxID=172713 RepID=UPI002DB79449|nr:GntR family transcriptional regulator [Paenibacillus kribbensis]MEC0233520.1 GntR family transcriptional regulator [Paenibacillus kribbensis]
MESYFVEKSLPFYDQLYHKIKKMILDGVFKPGERIVESKLAKEMNLSRTPIREAIRVLENEGLVVIDEKSRIIVYNPTVKDVEDVYQCRMALESLAVKLSVQRASDQEMAEIEKVLELCNNKIEQREYDKDEVIDLNFQFHNLIIHYSANDLLQKHLNSIKSRLHLYRILNFQGDDRAQIIYNEHKKIFDYMKEKNETKAAEAMVEHLNHDYKHLIGLLAT